MNYLYRHINIGVIIINQQGEITSYVGGKEFFQGGNNKPGNDSGTNGTNIIIDLMNKRAKIAPSSTIKPVIAY